MQVTLSFTAIFTICYPPPLHDDKGAANVHSQLTLDLKNCRLPPYSVAAHAKGLVFHT